MSNKLFGMGKNKSIKEILITLEHVKDGTIHKLSGFGDSEGIIPCMFKATDDFRAGDTIQIDDVEYTIQMSDGGKAGGNLFVTGSTSYAVVDADEKKINFKAGNGGSILLPATKFIEVTSNALAVTIKWEDADNQILNGAIISEWMGTKLIRKIGSPPTNELDGDVLVDNTTRNAYQTTGYRDEEVRDDVIYYYALFPYNTNGVYNYDISNIRKFSRLSAPVPQNTTGITVIPDIKSVKLRWSDGLSLTNALWAGTRVVRKAGSPPTNESDGVVILNNVNRDYYKSTYFVDTTATENVDYYYGFFPYSRDGNYNTKIENVASARPATGKIYTLSIDMSNLNPATACTYADDAVGMVPGDSWNEVDFFQTKPCLFKDGVVNYYINEERWSEKLDGSPSNLTGIDGDVMNEVSFFCVRTWFSGTKFNISISTDKQLVKSDLGYRCYPFIDKDGNIADKIYVGAYEGYIEDERMFSNSGKIFSSPRYSVTQILNACKAKGEHYYPYTLVWHQYLHYLYMMRFKTRSHFDNLIQDATTYVEKSGTLDDKGMYFKGSGIGKFMGFEYGATNSYLFLAGAKGRGSTNTSGSTTRYYRYLDIIHTSQILEETNAQNKYFLSGSVLKFYYSGANWSYGSTGYVAGVYANNSIMYRKYDDSTSAASSTGFVGHYSLVSYNASTITIFYSDVNTAPRKSFMNLNETAATSGSNKMYSSRLMYIKGEPE